MTDDDKVYPPKLMLHVHVRPSPTTQRSQIRVQIHWSPLMLTSHTIKGH